MPLNLHGPSDLITETLLTGYHLTQAFSAGCYFVRSNVSNPKHAGEVFQVSAFLTFDCLI